MPKKRKMSLTMTISRELFDAWQKLKRKGDSKMISLALERSRPVIDNALLYGYASIPELPDQINMFFLDRLRREKQMAKEMLELSQDVAAKKVVKN